MASDKIGKTFQVSVIVNVWGNDNAVSLSRSLLSVQRQSRKPDEVLIVVDGQINNSLNVIIQEFIQVSAFPVVRIDLANASGLWNARNTGIRSAKHEYIAVQDADDVMHPDRLRIQLDQIRQNDVDVLGTPVYEFDSVKETVIGIRSMAASNQINKKMIWQNVLNHSSVMVRKSAIVSAGGYRNVYLSEDYDLWLRLIYAGKKLSTTECVLQAFSVDGDLNRRRGGFKFISSELEIHRLLRSLKLINALTSWIRLALRLAFRLSPRFVRQIHRQQIQSQSSKRSASNLEEFLSSPPNYINPIL